MHRLSRIISGMLVIASCVLVSGAPLAQAYPSKPIRMIMPFPPGGPTDIVGRLVAAKLSEQIGQSVVADSRPGASGNVGLEIASKAPPDGYTIVLASPVIALSPLLYTKLNYGGMLAPTGTPREIINRLNAEFTKATTAPDMQPRFATAGVEPLTSTPEEFASFIRSEAARFAKVIKDAGIKAE